MDIRQEFILCNQLSMFSVNGECVGLLVAKSGPIGATEHVARSQLDHYVLFLIQSVSIRCEIQCNYKRVITLLNNEYLKENETLIFNVIVFIKSSTMIILVQKSCLHNDHKRNQSRTKIPYYVVVCFNRRPPFSHNLPRYRRAAT